MVYFQVTIYSQKLFPMQIVLNIDCFSDIIRQISRNGIRYYLVRRMKVASLPHVEIVLEKIVLILREVFRCFVDIETTLSALSWWFVCRLGDNYTRKDPCSRFYVVVFFLIEMTLCGETIVALFFVYIVQQKSSIYVYILKRSIRTFFLFPDQ